MAANVAAMPAKFQIGKQHILGVVGIITAVLLFWVVMGRVATNKVSTLRITWPGAKPLDPPLLDIPLPTVISVGVICGLLIAGALFLMLKSSPRGFTAYMGALIFSVLLIILLWAVAGSRIDVVDMLARTVRLATPIALGALAGILCERSGVINIAIEGVMLTGACVGYIVALLTTNSWVGLTAAMAAGGLTVMLLAALAIRFKTDQIIAGTVINILAVGVTGVLRNDLILGMQSSGYIGSSLPHMPIPVLSGIPIIGPVLFSHQPIAYAMLILVPLLSLLLFRTAWGLRTRAIGEHPRAADTMGINVNRLRYLNVFISGLVAGLAGAWFSLEATFSFDDKMTNGKGFIALAAMIFGKWTPFGAVGGAVTFSSADALQIKIQGYNFDLPSQFLQMMPYIITIVVLAGVIGRARPPAAVGKPYEK
ncbi:MAG TPA: ABC transporter permease [Chloroflexia bacterium]|nr:ABC transporter permease [Chloroflexia bacterium]